MRDDQSVSGDAASVRRASGYWLSTIRWDHFVSATCRDELSTDAIAREYCNGFVRRAARCTQGRIAWFAIVEKGKGGRRHLHALTWGTASVPVDKLRDAWKKGTCQVDVYSHGLGAAHYVTKDIVRSEWWNVSTYWPGGGTIPDRSVGRLASAIATVTNCSAPEKVPP